MSVTSETRLVPKLDWLAALKASLITGALFVILPMGSPWSGMTFSTGAIMGRETGFPSLLAIALHLCIALVYGFIIATLVKQFRTWRAILMGAAIGIALYGLNLAIVAALAREFLAAEPRVFVTHLLFGAFTSSIYKGMSREPIRRAQQPG